MGINNNEVVIAAVCVRGDVRLRSRAPAIVSRCRAACVCAAHRTGAATHYLPACRHFERKRGTTTEGAPLPNTIQIMHKA